MSLLEALDYADRHGLASEVEQSLKPYLPQLPKVGGSYPAINGAKAYVGGLDDTAKKIGLAAVLTAVVAAVVYGFSGNGSPESPNGWETDDVPENPPVKTWEGMSPNEQAAHIRMMRESVYDSFLYELEVNGVGDLARAFLGENDMSIPDNLSNNAKYKLDRLSATYVPYRKYIRHNERGIFIKNGAVDQQDYQNIQENVNNQKQEFLGYKSGASSLVEIFNAIMKKAEIAETIELSDEDIIRHLLLYLAHDLRRLVNPGAPAIEGDERFLAGVDEADELSAKLRGLGYVGLAAAVEGKIKEYEKSNSPEAGLPGRNIPSGQGYGGQGNRFAVLSSHSDYFGGGSMSPMLGALVIVLIILLLCFGLYIKTKSELIYYASQRQEVLWPHRSVCQ